jgi:hypothetical protein
MKMSKTYEEFIRDRLSGEKQKNALDFAAFLRANGFTSEWSDKHRGWNIVHKGKNLVFSTIFGDENVFAIVFNYCDFGDGESADDDLKEFAWKHAAVCPSGCGSSEICKKSRKGVIFGKEYANICVAPLECFDLDAQELEKAQRLILMLT